MEPKARKPFLSKTELEIKRLAASAVLASIMTLPVPNLFMRRISFLIDTETTRESTEKCTGVDLFKYTYILGIHIDKEMSF